MIYIIVGNIIALVASLLMVYSGLLKKAKDVIYVQSIQVTLFIASNLVLGGLSGAIVNALNLVRNIIFYNDKLTKIIKIILSILTITLCIYFNNLGIVGYLPMICAIIYLWLMDVPDPKKFKYLNIFTLILWIIYDLSILSFTSAAFDLATIITNIIALIKISKDKSKKDLKIDSLSNSVGEEKNNVEG